MIWIIWCRNGIQQRLNSWQDGVSGTNCPIQPGNTMSYDFEVKDQVGTFSYFPSINFLKAAGGFGHIRVNSLPMIKLPYKKPEAEYDVVISDWFQISYKVINSLNFTSHFKFFPCASPSIYHSISFT